MIDDFIKSENRPWYVKNPELLYLEKERMQKFFPAFQLHQLEDGRLTWSGDLIKSFRRGVHLDLVYEEDFSSDTASGDPIKVYLLWLEDGLGLDEITDPLPHTKRDKLGRYYLNDSYIDTSRNNAASNIAFVCKWLGIFEGWLEGDLTTREFETYFVQDWD